MMAAPIPWWWAAIRFSKWPWQIRNDGEILWAGHDRFQEKLQERAHASYAYEAERSCIRLLGGGECGEGRGPVMASWLRFNCLLRLREDAKLLEGRSAEAIDAPEAEETDGSSEKPCGDAFWA